MSQLLQRLAQPHHRLWLTAALLALVALGVARAFPPQPPPAQASLATLGIGMPREALRGLLSITADSRSTVAEADAARAANAALPLVSGGLQPARPFSFAADVAGADRALQCLALAMYYEAGYEGPAGRMAVAQVVLNRVRHPAFPNSVCAVVFQRSAGNICQFTFACDGALQRPRLPALWRRTLGEAAAALAGKVYAPVGMATHYHADYVFPAWAPRLDKIAVVGTHQFYRWPGGWGLRRAFTPTYAGDEPILARVDLSAAKIGEGNIAVPAELMVAAGEVAPRRSHNEGEFIDPATGWVPKIALPARTAGPTPTTGHSPAVATVTATAINTHAP